MTVGGFVGVGNDLRGGMLSIFVVKIAGSFSDATARALGRPAAGCFSGVLFGEMLFTDAPPGVLNCVIMIGARSACFGVFGGDSGSSAVDDKPVCCMSRSLLHVSKVEAALTCSGDMVSPPSPENPTVATVSAVSGVMPTSGDTSLSGSKLVVDFPRKRSSQSPGCTLSRPNPPNDLLTNLPFRFRCALRLLLAKDPCELFAMYTRDFMRLGSLTLGSPAAVGLFRLVWCEPSLSLDSRRSTPKISLFTSS